jgi:malonyl-CoA/methylmalonyl-CoA synthetase
MDTNIPYQEVDFFRFHSDIFRKTDLKPDDPGLIIYTSGTTGKPKGAVLTQKNLVHDAENIIKIWKITTSDVLCHALPLFHVHGLCFALHTAFLVCAGIVLTDGFLPDHVATLLEKKFSTLFMAVPAMYVKLMDHFKERRPNFDHIRLLTSGSAPLLVRDFNKIHDVFGKKPVEREGMSETGMNFSNPIDGIRKPGSIGIPLPGLEVRIVDPVSYQNVKPGEEGEIWLKGPGITPGYWRKPEETSQVFSQGWFRTGDLGIIDTDGYYYLTDRIKHIIISGGENISPKEIESVINRMEGVVESSVVGLPDEKWGEKVVAAVVRKPNSQLTTNDIQTFCKKHLHDWKCPKNILFIEEIPKNTMGKVLKEEVNKKFQT